MSDLPIDALKTEFDLHLQSHHWVISAETGSGKSTRLPLWAAAHGKVLVVEPRRIACIALARYLAEQKGQSVGEDIGYAIRFDAQLSEQSQVVFVTPGVALRWLSENGLADYAVVMLDEFHERRWDTDLLLALLNKRQQHRLIVTSATMESDRIARFIQAKTLHSDGRQFSVEVMHHSDEIRQMPSTRQLSHRIKQAVAYALAHSDKDILVFLPSKKEIHEARQSCQSDHALYLELHAGSDDKTQSLALNAQSQRRVIFTTNVAETSLTIPNIGVVIDSGLERRTHLRGGRTVLGLDPIARDAAAQRQGRAGRTSAGLCIRLYGQHAPLMDRTPVQLERESLEDFVLSAACCGENVTALPLLTTPNDKALQRAFDLLGELGALDENGCATEHGCALHPLPVDLTLSHLLVKMPSRALKQAMADVAGVIAVGGKAYTLPTGADWDALTELLRPLCDVSLLVAWLRAPKRLPLQYDTKQWQEAHRYSQALRKIFALPEVSSSDNIERRELIGAILNASPASAFVKRRNRRGAFGNGEVEVVLGDGSIVDDKAEAIIVLDRFALAGRAVKDSKTIATLAMPIDYNDLIRAGLGDIRYDGAQLKDDQVIRQQVRHYAGVEIERRPTVVTGPALLDALTQLIAEGRLIAGLYSTLVESIEAFSLYCQLDGDTQPVPSADRHIRQCLSTLGVERLDDLELLDPDDFAFDGIPEWRLNDFLETYPQQVVLPELTMRAQYQAGAKRVTLHYLSGQRTEPPKRWELPAWSGWRIRYQKASKVVDIK